MVRVRLRADGMRQLLTSPAMEAIVASETERIAAAFDPPVDTGELAASLFTETRNEGDRIRGYAGFRAPHALVVQARTGFMTRAVGGA